jgi:glutamine synthetase
MANPLRDFLEISYDELEELNLGFKEQRLSRVAADKIQEERMKFLADQKGIKAVTVCFSDIEGRLHMLDYDKKFLLKSVDNLTFDGSSIRGFSAQFESDLRLVLDWSAFYLLPSDVFGPGKVLAFSEVLERDGSPYHADMRSRLKSYTQQLYEEQGLTLNAANEIEGFLFKGRSAEQRYAETGGFEYVTTSGYYHTLPGNPLRKFIDHAAEAQRAMGFSNEKDHPEVAPSQFEMNYSYTEAVAAADQVQLYKLLARQVALLNDTTASFLPKPVTGVNGNGMHTNVSISENGTNLFWDEGGQDQLSPAGWEFINRILNSGNDICLILNSSVNSYRRLDPHFEAPNQIKASAIDRGSMVRIPLGNSRSKRTEVRSIAPDANPYMAIYTIFRTGLEGPLPSSGTVNQDQILPDNIYDAVSNFQSSAWACELLGQETYEKYIAVKVLQAERCAMRLGTLIKTPEIQFHHEVTNQHLWTQF